MTTRILLIVQGVHRVGVGSAERRRGVGVIGVASAELTS